jgi:MFS family permease
MKEKTYKNYLLTLLLVILAFNYVDRNALGLLLQEIKVDLHLSDTQLGLMSGIAFAFFYSIMGIPIARWADRGNRITIITLTTALWSVAVALCGAAGSFAQLLLVRVGVAVGEAGCVPPAHSLIADHFTRAERPRAVARYLTGIPLSLLIGFFLAGWLNELVGWRMTFVLLGLPGLVLAVLSWFTLYEPRLKSDITSEPKVAPPEVPLMTVFGQLWGNRTFRHILLGYSVASFFGQGIVQWKAAFFIRSFGLTTGELGTWFALIYGIFGSLGAYLSGEWAARRAANNERLQLRFIGLAYSSFAFVSMCIYLSTTAGVAFVFLTIATIGFYTINGPLFAMMQSLVPERMRAMSMALVLLFGNLIGMGLGPVAAGILSDVFREWAGEESLRYALLSLCPGYIWSGWHFWRASRTVVLDLRSVGLESEALEGQRATRGAEA